MVAFPDAGDLFVGLGHRWINMDSAPAVWSGRYCVHRQYEFSQQVSGMFANDRHA